MTITTTATHEYKGYVSKSVRFLTAKGIEVALCHSINNGTWTVIYRPTNRSLGITFASPDEMMAHYKTIRAELLEAMRHVN